MGGAVAVLFVVTGLQSTLPSATGLTVPNYRVRQGGTSCWAYTCCVGVSTSPLRPNMHSRWCSFLSATAGIFLSRDESEVLNWSVRFP